jgi:hypothetical protein
MLKKRSVPVFTVLPDHFMGNWQSAEATAMAILGNEKTLQEYMEAVDTGVTRFSFGLAFRAFVPAKALQSRVDREAMDRFYAAANEFLRLKAVGKVIDKRRMLADYKLAAKLIMGTDKKLEGMEAAVCRIQSRTSKRGRTRTGPISHSMLRRLTSFRKELRVAFADTLRNVQAHQNQLELVRPNKEVAEFMIDLSNILKSRFPTMKQADRWALIGAAMAGAKLYTAKELKEAAEDKRELIDRIRQKLVLAQRHRKKTRNADDERIALESFSPITKKLKSAAKKKKQSSTAKAS